jgi:hypothetical protein
MSDAVSPEAATSNATTAQTEPGFKLPLSRPKDNRTESKLSGGGPIKFGRRTADRKASTCITGYAPKRRLTPPLIELHHAQPRSDPGRSRW